MERSASAAARLADVVCRPGLGVGESLVLAVHAAVAGKFAGGDCAAREQSVSSRAAALREGVALRLSLFHPGRKKSHRGMVGAAARRNLSSRSSSQVMIVSAELLTARAYCLPSCPIFIVPTNGTPIGPTGIYISVWLGELTIFPCPWIASYWT